jgi:hypothetical protein
VNGKTTTFSSRVLDGRADWARDARGALRAFATWNAANYQVRAPQNVAVSGQNLNGKIVFAGSETTRSGNATANWNTSGWTMTQRAPGTVLNGSANGKTLRGELNLAGSLNNHDGSLQFAATGAALQSARLGNGRAANARGVASWQTRGGLQSPTPMAPCSSIPRNWCCAILRLAWAEPMVRAAPSRGVGKAQRCP